MRKFMLLAVASVVAALGIVGVASAINGTQEISVSTVNSKAGTKSKPKSVGLLRVVTTTTPAQGEGGTFATQKAVLYFDKNIVFSPSKFKTCSKTQVEGDSSKCPSGSKVGTGSATAVFQGQTIALTVKPFNGPGGNKIFLLVQNSAFGINKALDGTLSNGSGAYGKKLTVTIPANLQQPIAGGYATLTQFRTNVGGTSKGVPYTALKGCTGGKLKYKGTFYYTDGTNKTATTTSKCSK